MHDISRALQCLIKHATEEQRNAIFDEIKGTRGGCRAQEGSWVRVLWDILIRLIFKLLHFSQGDLVEMAKNKYAKNFIKRILDKGSKDQRELIMASFSSHVPEMVRNSVES